MQALRTVLVVVVSAVVVYAVELLPAGVGSAAGAVRLPAPVPDGVAPQPSADQPYVYRRVNDHLYVIAEIHQPFPRDEPANPPHTQQMGLIIGRKKAALIDTGLGLADLRSYVERFTSLPVVVLNTHGHVDHVGANQLFDMSYIAREDADMMLRATRAQRLRGYEEFMAGNQAMIEFAKRSMVGDRPYNYGYIKDGERIDLGGIQIEVIGFPGHSPGSVAYVDRQDGIAFTGDSMLFRVLLGDRQKLAQWAQSVRNFADRTRGIDTIINGHQWEPFHRSDIDEELALADAIQQRSITGTRKYLLFADRTIYQLGSKRIGLTNDE